MLVMKRESVKGDCHLCKVTQFDKRMLVEGILSCG